MSKRKEKLRLLGDDIESLGEFATRLKRFAFVDLTEFTSKVEFLLEAIEQNKSQETLQQMAGYVKISLTKIKETLDGQEPTP